MVCFAAVFRRSDATIRGLSRSPSAHGPMPACSPRNLDVGLSRRAAGLTLPALGVDGDTGDFRGLVDNFVVRQFEIRHS